MPDKFEELRNGKAVEVRPGVSARLNKEKKTLQLSTGERFHVADNPKYFPKNEQELQYTRQKEATEKGVQGAGGEFLHQYTTQGVPGGVRDWYSYLTENGENYANKKRAEQEVSQRISKESPYLSGAATAANIGTDIALTKGMSGLAAAPLLTAGASGSRILTEPGEVALETAGSAAGGYLLDKGVNYLSKMAQRRGATRALPGQQAEVRQQNIAGQTATDQANLAAKAQFQQQTQQHAQEALANKNQFIAQENSYKQAKIAREQQISQQRTQEENFFRQEKTRVKNENTLRLEAEQTAITSRKNQIVNDQNEYATKVAARDAEIVKLKNQANIDKAERNADAVRSEAEYKAAKEQAEQENKIMNERFKLDQKQYEQQLKNLPEMQKKAQAEYSENVVKNAQQIETSFPKNSKTNSDELFVNQFIDESIDKSGIGGSTQAFQAKRILNSLFPEGEILTGKEISKRYKALEDAIQKSSPEIQTVLKDFKEHLGKRLTIVLKDSIAYNKVLPALKKSLANDVSKILKEISFEGRGQAGAKVFINNIAKSNVNTLLKNELTPTNFIQKLQNGDISKEIANKILTVEDFLHDISPQSMKALEKKGTLNLIYEEAQRKHAYFENEIKKIIDSKLSKAEIDALSTANKLGKKFATDIRKTYGLAESVIPPLAPKAGEPLPLPQVPQGIEPVPPFQFPEPITPPIEPPLPQKAQILPEPTLTRAQEPPLILPPQKPSMPQVPQQPTLQTFSPQIEPTLPAAQGFSENAADFLEKNLLGGKGLVNNPFTKLAGLKYVLGGAALPLEAGYLGAKALTSPTAGGEVARTAFKQGSVQAIESLMQKYPSYHNGILEDPQDRRSVTKEIEDEQELPIEQKAVFQSKINRGKPLNGKL